MPVECNVCEPKRIFRLIKSAAGILSLSRYASSHSFHGLLYMVSLSLMSDVRHTELQLQAAVLKQLYKLVPHRVSLVDYGLYFPSSFSCLMFVQILVLFGGLVF